MSFDTIIDVLKKAIQEQPQDVALQLHLAEVYIQSADYRSTVELCKKILEAEPANIRALQAAVKAYRELGDAQKATGLDILLQALNAQNQTPASNIASVVPQHGPQNSDNKPMEKTRLRLVETGDNIAVGPWVDTEHRVTLDDVGGMYEVKKRLQTSFLAPLKNPELAKMYAKSLKGGLLLYGPPGCGKTFIARALAGELGAKFISVGLADILDMWLGESERKLHEIFETARRSAPTVVFFDEMDALGQKRSHLRHSGGRNVVNQLLAEMDSVGSENRNVFVLGATNHPWDIDTALRRPGRFDRMILVLPPDQAAREHILSYHMRDRPVDPIRYTDLAKHCDGFSGADLAHLCETAVEKALEDCVSQGETRPVRQQDFEAALPEVRPSTRAWFETARNYAMFANEGGMYDDLLNFIRTHKL